MRPTHLAALALAAASLALPAVAAQTGLAGSHFAFAAVQSPTSALAAGSIAPLNLTLSRTCDSAATVLSASTVRLVLSSDADNLTFAGPMQVEFPQQVCASDPEVQQSVAVQMVVPDAAATATTVVRATGSPMPSGAGVNDYAAATQTSFPLRVEAKSAPAASVAQAAPVKTSPAAAPLLALGALGVALVARRSRAD